MQHLGHQLRTLLKPTIRGLAHRVSLDVVPFTPASHPLARRKQLLVAHRIDTVIDVGANEGQYASGLRHLGFSGRIISIEPLQAAFRVLEREHRRRPENWEIFNFAMGAARGEAVLNVAANSVSSSLLPMLPTHLASAPNSNFTHQQPVPVETIEHLIDEHVPDPARIFVKTDAQGSDHSVLSGIGENWPRVVGVQVEMSLIELYSGEVLFVEMTSELLRRGFVLMSIEPGFANPKTGQLLQADGVFFRAEDTSSS